MTDAVAARTTGHPKGLYLLFATEAMERLSYYGMRALLVLYLVDRTRGGFGWDHARALELLGLYAMGVYVTPLLGGWLADTYLGQRRSVVFGGVLMMVGHFLLALPGLTAFYAGLAFLVAGNGLFKPNIATMVGGLYPQGDARRDSAFTIFYMGVNLGAFFAPWVCGILGEKVGWHWGFGSAGVGMGVGLVLFLALSRRLLGDVGLAPAPRRAAMAAGAPARTPLTRVERERMLVVPILALFNIFFWTAYEQAGGLMTLYTDQKVDRMLLGWEVPTTLFQSVNPAFIMLLGPVLAGLWTALGRRGRNPSSAFKMGLGITLLGVGFIAMAAAAQQSANGGKAALGLVVLAYFFHTAGELCLSPVGLSMVTKLAPVRFASLLMATWYLSNAASNYLAGKVGALSVTLGELQVFVGLAAAPITAGLVLMACSPLIKRMMHGAEELRAPAPVSQEEGVREAA